MNDASLVEAVRSRSDSCHLAIHRQGSFGYVTHHLQTFLKDRDAGAATTLEHDPEVDQASGGLMSSSPGSLEKQKLPEALSLLSVEALFKRSTGDVLSPVVPEVGDEPVNSKVDVLCKRDCSASTPSEEPGQLGVDENMNQIETTAVITTLSTPLDKKSGNAADTDNNITDNPAVDNSLKLGQSLGTADTVCESRDAGAGHVHTTAEAWKEIEDYVPNRTLPKHIPESENCCRRISLIQISRLPPRKRAKRETAIGRISSDDESLFKGWIGIPRKKPEMEKLGLLSRILSSIQRRCYIYIFGPICHVFTKSNRVFPIKLSRSGCGSRSNSYSRERNVTRRQRYDPVPATDSSTSTSTAVDYSPPSRQRRR